MKKFACFAVAALVFAAVAWDIGDYDEKIVVAPQSVTAGHAVTNTASIAGYTGYGEVCVPYASASTGVVVTATLQATNVVDGGWVTVNTRSATGESSGVVRLPFARIYLPHDLRVIVGATGANATVGAIMSAHK